MKLFGTLVMVAIVLVGLYLALAPVISASADALQKGCAAIGGC